MTFPAYVQGSVFAMVTSHAQVLHIFPIWPFSGFIFTGDITHRMLTATQYIAPLMANFDPSYSKDSTVQYLDNGKMPPDIWTCPRFSDCLISCLTPVWHSLFSGEVFVVQWERVRLLGKESEGTFTFQAALYKTGTITFSYRDVSLPCALSSLPNMLSSKLKVIHLFVCLSDTSVIRCDWLGWASSEGRFVWRLHGHITFSSITRSAIIFMPVHHQISLQGVLRKPSGIWPFDISNTEAQQRTIYEYHRVEIDTTKISSYSAVEFTALPSKWSISIITNRKILKD